MKLRTIHRSQYNSKLKKLLSRGLVLVMILSNIPAHSFANSVNTEENKYIEELSNIKTKEDLENSAQKSVKSGNADTWITGLASMTSTRSGATSAVVDGKIYVFGGYNDSYYLNTVEMYDPETNKWISKANMSTARMESTSAVVDGKIYVIGGMGEDGPLNKVEVYDPETNKWTSKADMLTAREGLTSAVVDGKIYCIGGMSESSVLKKVEMYDPETNKWISKANMSSTRTDLTSAVVDGKIYCIGGDNGSNYLSKVEMYDPVEDTWETKTNMPTKRKALASNAIGKKIYCIGGINSNFATLQTVEVYDVETNEWTTGFKSMPTARYSLTSSAIDGKIYCIGGYSAGFTLNTLEVYNAGKSNEEIAEEAVAKAEQTRDPIDIEIARDLVNKLPESPVKEELSNRLDALMPKSSTSNIDIYIVPSNMLALSIDTNSVTFEDFDGVDDMEMPNAINLEVKSTLPYKVDVLLETEIQNADGTNILDKSILGIKSNNSSVYQTFTAIKTPVTLLDIHDVTESNSHGIDLKLNKDVNYKVDIYKTTIKFEVIQK